MNAPSLQMRFCARQVSSRSPCGAGLKANRRRIDFSSQQAAGTLWKACRSKLRRRPHPSHTSNPLRSTFLCIGFPGLIPATISPKRAQSWARGISQLSSSSPKRTPIEAGGQRRHSSEPSWSPRVRSEACGSSCLEPSSAYRGADL